MKFGRVFQPALPYNQNLPAEFFELGYIFFVAGFVGEAFGLPEIGVGGRFDAAVPAIMQMPETAVNEDYFFVAR